MNTKKKYFLLTVTALLMGYSFSSFGSDNQKSKWSEECENTCISGVIPYIPNPDPDPAIQYTAMSIIIGYDGAINDSLTTINKLRDKENEKINF